MDSLLSREEVRQYLEVENPDLDQLIEKGKLHAYKIGGSYLRFRKDEVLTIKHEFQTKKGRVSLPWFIRLLDFWRFNNFYILSLLFIVALFFLIIVRF